jgi:hypothetical protein
MLIPPQINLPYAHSGGKALPLFNRSVVQKLDYHDYSRCSRPRLKSMMDDILDEDNPCKVDCLKCNGDACNGTGVVIY